MRNYFWISIFFLVISFTNPLLAGSDDHNDHKNEHMHDNEHADEQMFEEHSSHVHGHATAQISYVENILHIRKTLSSIDVFGFEHAPKNEEQNKTIAQSIGIMEKADLLFRFKNNACELESVQIENELVESDTDSHQDHDSHEDEHHHDHDEETHDKDTEEESHSDVIANYTFKCDSKKLETIEYLIFDHFPSLEEIEVQYISDHNQALFHATHSNRVQKLH